MYDPENIIKHSKMNFQAIFHFSFIFSAYM